MSRVRNLWQVLCFLSIIFLFSGCHLFKQGRYKMVNGMKFQTFTLKNNLQVLTISDERFVKSSAALAVMAGSMENPDKHLGLAHFLEHMLFLGTKEFPKVGEYEDFLNKNGGGHNAYTSMDHTNYFFDISHGAYQGALERFSRFFVSPTFDQKYIDREKKAVNSEHEKNRKDDGRREYRMQQVMSDPNHPFAKFATGDEKTLAAADREIVMKFYQDHYSANLMRLVLMSNQSPETLKDLANKFFGDVQDKNLKKPTYSEKVFPKDGPLKEYRVQSVRDQEVLKISFSIPDETPYWESKPANMLAHLVGDEGEGSILSLLKSKGLALGLSTSTWWRSFNVRITLTESGKKEYAQIVRTVLEYIELLKVKGLEKHVFEERKKLSKIDLDNIEPKSSMGRASDFSASMLFYSADRFLQEHYLFHKYSTEEFNKFLAYLKPENMQIMMMSQSVKGDKKEPYYGVMYSESNLDGAALEKFKPTQKNENLALPGTNPFVPENLDLVASSGIQKPVKKVYKEKATIQYQVDTDLGIPKGSIVFSIISDVVKGDPKAYLTGQLFALAKRQELNEWGYPPRLAGLDFSVRHESNTISVEASGYNDHLPLLLKSLFEDKKNSRKLNHVKLPKDLFLKIREKYKKNLMNVDHDAAYQQLLYEHSMLFSTGPIHRNRYRDMVDQITLEDINQFAERFFKKVALRVYGYGNISEKQLFSATDAFLESITQNTFSDKEVESFENKFIDLPPQRHLIKIKGSNNNNSLFTAYKATKWTIVNQAYIEILSKIVEQPFFTELRTQQQLGYIVAAFGASSNGYCGLGALVQSQNTQPVEIYKKSHNFIGKLLLQLSEKITDKDIDPIKKAILTELSKKPNTLGERLARFTAMAGNYHGDFEFYNKLQDAVRQIDAKKLKSFIVENFIKGDRRGEVTFLYYGSNSKPEDSPKELQLISNVEKFKEKAEKFQPYRESKNQ